MDSFTRHHLDAWLYHQIVDEDRRDAVRTAMIDRFNEDPEWWGNHTWTELYYLVQGNTIEAAQ